MIYNVQELINSRDSKSNNKLAHILYDSDTKKFLISKVGKGIPLTEELKKKFNLQETKYKTLKTDFDYCNTADYIYYKIKDGYSFQDTKKDISLCLVLNFPYATPNADFLCPIDFLYTVGDASSTKNICTFQIPSAFFPCIDSFSKEIDTKMNSYLVDLCYWALVSANVKLGVDIESIHKKTELLSTGKRFKLSFNGSFFHHIDTGRPTTDLIFGNPRRVTGYLSEQPSFKVMTHSEHLNQHHINPTILNIDPTSKI